MNIEELQMSISDLASVEPRSIATDREAKEAAVWIEMEKKTEADAEALLGPQIKSAFESHRKLTGEKKSLLEKLLSAKDRVRAGVANWIGAGHDVPGCYIKTVYKVTVIDPAQVPDEYAYRAVDEKKLAEWAKLTEGKVAIPGCVVEPVRVLYAKEVA